MRVIPAGTTLTTVNHVDLEEYLPGVVPREMPPQWGDTAPAALEAQAIAARSYAMATRRSGGEFDMYADERSQVYGGASAEDPRANAAVAATAGKVVTLNGQIVTTFFFSTSGGRTENVENVFSGGPRSYLVSVDDNAFDATSPHHVWRDPKTFTDARTSHLMGIARPGPAHQGPAAGRVAAGQADPVHRAQRHLQGHARHRGAQAAGPA